MRKRADRGNRVFCIGSFKEALSKHCLSWLKGCHSRSDLLHHASKIKARNIRERKWFNFFKPTSTDLPIYGVHASCANADQYLPFLGNRTQYLFKFEFLGSTIVM